MSLTDEEILWTENVFPEQSMVETPIAPPAGGEGSVHQLVIWRIKPSPYV